MANATNTTPGEIQLAGDLAGNNDATAPELITTGVTPGTYTTADVTVDSKGRITAASNGTLVPANYAATNSQLGTIQLAGDLAGNNNANAPALTSTGVTPGTYNLADITVDSKGRLTAVSGSDLNAVAALLPTATTSTLGVIQVGDYLTETSGVLDLDLATNTTFGAVKPADTARITISNGLIDLNTNFVRSDTETTFSAGIHTTPVSITANTANTAIDASLGNVFEVDISANTQLDNPTNLEAGSYTFIITQDPTGSRLMTFGTLYNFKLGGNTTLSTAPNAVDVLSCVSDGTNLYCALGGGFS